MNFKNNTEVHPSGNNYIVLQEQGFFLNYSWWNYSQAPCEACLEPHAPHIFGSSFRSAESRGSPQKRRQGCPSDHGARDRRRHDAVSVRVTHFHGRQVNILIIIMIALSFSSHKRTIILHSVIYQSKTIVDDPANQGRESGASLFSSRQMWRSKPARVNANPHGWAWSSNANNL